MLIKRASLYLNCNYLVQTKCIMRKNGGGPGRGKRAGPWRSATLWRPSVAPLGVMYLHAKMRGLLRVDAPSLFTFSHVSCRGL